MKSILYTIINFRLKKVISCQQGKMIEIHINIYLFELDYKNIYEFDFVLGNTLTSILQELREGTIS